MTLGALNLLGATKARLPKKEIRLEAAQLGVVKAFVQIGPVPFSFRTEFSFRWPKPYRSKASTIRPEGAQDWVGEAFDL